MFYLSDIDRQRRVVCVKYHNKASMYLLFGTLAS